MKTAASDCRDIALKSAGKAYKFGIFQREKCPGMIEKGHKKWYNVLIKTRGKMA